MAVKCFMSGVESNQHFYACMDADVEHVLTSFLYLEKKGDFDIVKRRKKKFPNLKVMVDSGAHSFITDAGKYKSWSMQDFENYIERYVRWIKANKDYIFCAVEFDIDFALNFIFAGNNPTSLFGPNKVAEWQEKYFLPLQEKGIEIIYVWHVERGLEGWESMCSRFGYVGLPGEMSSGPDFNKYVTVARRYTTKVHGFAATKQADFRDWPWYSVDSITWKTSEMYGTLIDWDERKQVLKFEADKAKRINYRQKFMSFGLNADAIIAESPGSYKEVTKYALISMSAMEKFYARKYADSVFYYELRLPHPVVVNILSDSVVSSLWARFRPNDIFKQHADVSDVWKLRQYVLALSAVQYKLESFLSQRQACLDFLGTYFAGQVLPKIQNIQILQQELGNYIAPPNRRAIRRTLADYIPTNNVPKPRSDVDYTFDELEDDRQIAVMLEDEI